MTTQRRVLVVGAGITGLTAAFTLATKRPDLNITVIEASDRVGGKILTTPFAGRPVDCGADAFLARVPEALELCHELGLDTVLTSPVQKSAYVWVNGSLHRLPTGLVLGVPTDLDALAASSIISTKGIARATEDLIRTDWVDHANGPDPDGVDDQSVGALIRARLGDEIHEKLVSPLLSGVNAGDADYLSLAAGAAQIAAAARQSPSLISALRAQSAAAAIDPQAPVFRGIPVGTQTLTDLLLAQITKAGVAVHLSCAATSLARVDNAWCVATPAGPLLADEVILSTSAHITARLLETLAPEPAQELAELGYASAAMVALAVSKQALGVALDASGFLVAQTDPLPTLTACSWASAKWAHLDDPEVAILRVSAGKFGDTHALDLTDTDLVDALTTDLSTTMGLDAAPLSWRVTRWIDGLPQYQPGHPARVRRWRAGIADVAPGVHLAGAAYDGLGLPACIRQGRQAAYAIG
ncbi:MAG: protoporphyrinogen oxidase [Acidimicrobiales bacterium]